MSNLDLILLEGDNEGLMTAAMDLIDSIASDSATGSSDDNSSAITDLSRRLAETAPRKPRRKRVAKPGYSTEQGRRKKAEVLALRSQVQGLEQWIQHLKRHKVAGVAPSERRAASPAPADQSRQAMEEFQKRQKSEVANRKLKAVMATQTELGKAILEIIRQNAALKMR
ncbi:hypothetical protein PR003_g8988 [Phytophthora rubi]|uniref:Uncharacterized protein n=1 Tax=Phytophthora rubi TaxID=129364 RepID=A0A6A3N7K1_9STRA|nr:hypothetical protein PR001_g8301 [Phytophthora rubi]KAE9343418.1 hypothetical protein PR003_g8988 [Phytophthora rubi]